MSDNLFHGLPEGGIISNNGASIISNNGAGIISNNGASIISNNGASSFEPHFDGNKNGDESTPGAKPGAKHHTGDCYNHHDGQDGGIVAGNSSR